MIVSLAEGVGKDANKKIGLQLEAREGLEALVTPSHEY